MKNLFLGIILIHTLFFFCSKNYASTITLQPGSEGKDAYIKAATPSMNLGTESFFVVRGGILSQHSILLIEFNLSIIPEHAVVTNALLALDKVSGSTESLLNVYRITSDWSETDVTYENQPSFDLSVPIANIGGIALLNTFVEWDITEFVHYWHEYPSENYGLEMRSWSGLTNVFFRTSDYETHTSLRPKLTITYSMIPEPLSIILVGLSGIFLMLRKYK